MGCNCKNKNKELTTLTTVSKEDLEKADELLGKIAKMTEEDWDFVVDVYKQIYPAAADPQRNCSSCMRRVAKWVHQEYQKQK
jgi:hypothetical protein